MSRVRRWLILWFGFDQPVEPRTYLAHEYGVDVLLVWLVLHRLWMPLDYVNPALSLRFGTNTIPEWLLFTQMVWTLPFLWIGFGMTMRRAVDAARLRESRALAPVRDQHHSGV